VRAEIESLEICRRQSRELTFAKGGADAAVEEPVVLPQRRRGQVVACELEPAVERGPDGDVGRAHRSGRYVVDELSERPVASRLLPRTVRLRRFHLPLSGSRPTLTMSSHGLSFAHVAVHIASVRARSRAIVG
jgi:hypothetical protein